ncbi:hypothetical protein GMJLKIPL_2392 [Methylobacterium isbiliense]|uniref:Uncharacterized protein n=1 Tax=Methylobacterium isbiliense TaxID=315478 RepID=A0ABQ4SF90_9HYPH|nr:hypothetical protein GMJLKIPL_2392 [Methylobacterium isbiliense]
MQERDVEWAGSTRIPERRSPERSIGTHGEDHEAVGIRRVRDDKLRRPVGVNCWSGVEQYVDEKITTIRREDGLRRDPVRFRGRVDGVSVGSEREFPVRNGVGSNVVRAERVQHVEGTRGGSVGKRLRCSAASGYGFARRLGVYEGQTSIDLDAEGRDAVVAPIRSEEIAIRICEDHAVRAFERVRCALLTADRLENAGAGASGRHGLDRNELAIGQPPELHHTVRDLVRLHVNVPREGAAWPIRLRCSQLAAKRHQGRKQD